MPKVSVVMPAYNAEKYICEAIDSILNQTFTDFEFLIINDGSTDRTKELILSYNNPCIVYLENERNSGIVVTLNKGLDSAKGEYIARMDADDIAISSRLEKQVAILESDKTIGVLGTGTRIFGETVDTHDTTSSTNSDKLKAELLFSPCICHPSVMIRKSVLEKYNIRYKNEFKGAEDYEMWWQIARVSKILATPEVLHCYRIHPHQVTKVKDESYFALLDRMLDLRLETLDIKLTDDERKSFLLYCFGQYESYEKQSMELFIDTLYKMLNANAKVKFFNQFYLREVMALAVEYSLNNSSLTDDDRSVCRKDAKRKGIYPLTLRIKLIAHKIIGR